MTELRDSIDRLTALGWSEYDSKTFSALVLLGRASASQISKKADVPTNRVYQILEKLAGKGYVNRVVGHGGPAVFEAKNPEIVLQGILKEQSELVESAKEALLVLLERQVEEDIPRSFTIIGRRELNSYLQEYSLKSDKEILFYFDTLLEIKHAEIVEILNALKKGKRVVKILTNPRGINDAYEKDVYKEIKSIPVKITEDHFASILMICDENYLIFTSYALTETEFDVREYFGVFLEDKNTIKMFKKMFESSWEGAIEPHID